MEWVQVSPRALAQFIDRVAPGLSESEARLYLWRQFQPLAAGRAGLAISLIETRWGPVRVLLQRRAVAGRDGVTHWRLDLHLVFGRLEPQPPEDERALRAATETR